MFTIQTAKKWFAALAKVLEENKNRLTDLDTAIGNAATPAEFGKAFSLGVDGIIQIGHSKPGEKTMLDALIPALEAAQQSIESNVDFNAALLPASEAARIGADSTVPMLAVKGRASYLGVRSIGYMDPGAFSAYLILRTLAELRDQ
ncbi:MAG: dihydroxyacetone kinase subunit L [Deferribacteraceae bacterium]|jgi:dihydroxyacetone kinase-like protein|nr:dihydroxyacetone kinase subunit L [Deferribacteraceae bacterium]